MSGQSGTPRFGAYPDAHISQTGDDDVSRVRLQTGSLATPDMIDELHFAYNPAQRSREMGTTLGGKPGEYYQQAPRIYDAPSNHDGFFGGDTHLVNVDERKLLETTIMSVPIVCADDWQRNFDSQERTA